MMGFLQSAQPAATTESALTTTAGAVAGEELFGPDSGPDCGTVQTTAVPGLPSPTTTHAPFISGTSLPAGGNSLPPDMPELPAGATISAQSDAEAGARDTLPAARISLADIESSRQLNMTAISRPAPTDVESYTRRFTLTAAAPGLSVTGSVTDSTPDLLPAVEAGGNLAQPAGLTAGDLSRLVQNLSHAGGREPFSAAFSTEGTGMNALFSESSPTAGGAKSTDSGLGSMVRGGLNGFPPLQPLGSPQAWTAGLGDRLLTLAGPGTHSARLRLHPESLGTLDIEIKVADHTAQVWFGAQHSQTREAIEASLPQLREMFAEQGIRLTQAQVDSGTNQRAPDQQSAFNDSGNDRNAWRRPPVSTSLPDALAPIHQATHRLLDAWA